MTESEEATGFPVSPVTGEYSMCTYVHVYVYAFIFIEREQVYVCVCVCTCVCKVGCLFFILCLLHLY